MKNTTLIMALLLTVSTLESSAHTSTHKDVKKSSTLAKNHYVVPKRNGKQLFAKCITCHGLNAEKTALSKSKVIRGWESKKIINALNGYKNGSYGGKMRGVMEAQIKSYTDEDIKKVAEFIATL